MYEFLLQQWRETHRAKKLKKHKPKKEKRKDETPEEQKARKERKRVKKAAKRAQKSEGLRGVEALLHTLDRRQDEGDDHSSPYGEARRSRSRSLALDDDRRPVRDRSRSPRRRHGRPSRSPIPPRNSPPRQDFDDGRDSRPSSSRRAY
jgi:RNA-binding motif X-linked protein 2